MSSTPTADEIWRDARWLAQALDPGAGLVRFVEMPPESYRSESFLDDRLLRQGRGAHLVKWTELESARPADTRTDARWIFHIGHVGSTLISRLLGELDVALAVREPRSLRDLTFFPREVRNAFVPGVRALMSRTFRRDQTAVIKATSMVSEIAAELTGNNGRSLFLYASPDAYLRTILAGDSSPAELQALAGYYSSRAEGAGIPIRPATGSQADAAALVWACEMTALERAAEQLAPDSILWLDFDSFLASPEQGLLEVTRFFGLSAEKNRLAEIIRGPLMNRYSKAPEYEFGPETRRQLLATAAEKHAVNIDAALAMLNQAAEKAPPLARALLRSTPDR